jgi:hypothetical protein
MSSSTRITTTDATEFEAIQHRLARWRSWMVRRYSTFEDVDAIIDESFWTQHSAGVIGDPELMRAAEIAVRRHVRAEARVWDLKVRLKESAAEQPSFLLEERVVDSLAASQCLSHIDIPARAWVWLQRAQHPGSLSAADESYGRRWAARTREALSNVA